MAGILEELSGAVSELVQRLAPSVVGVGAGGSGAVVRPGYVVTNAHNLRDRDDEVLVTFADGSRVAASVAGVDVDGDVALLSVETGSAAPLEWAEQPARLGQAVVALANPGGRGTRASLGFVSALDVGFSGPSGRRITGAIEHTAPLVRGSSGGPLLDGSGRLLGIDTNREGDGFYLAIAASAELRGRLEGLGRGERPRRARLGVALVPRQVARRLRAAVGLPARDGLLVHAVEDGQPAARAGIRAGDLLVAAAGAALTDLDDLAAALADASAGGDAGEGAGGTIELGVVRGAEELTVTVELGTGEDAE